MAQQLRTDRTLFYTIVLMVFFGLVLVYSASSVMAELRYGYTWYFLLKQSLWAIAAFILLMFLKARDYRNWQGPVWAFAPLGVILALLVVVYFADGRRHRWLTFSFVSIQPSEFAKPALAIFLAWFITRRMRAINDRHTLYPALVALGVLAATVVIADLGTAVVLVATAGAVFYIAGLHRKYLAMALAAGLVIGSVAVLSKPYRLARLVAWVDPGFSLVTKLNPGGELKAYLNNSLTSRDAAYQPLQSRIAVGSGGAFGLGLMQSRQKLLFLPEAHTDFIYAVIAEELGLWGALLVLLGFMVIIWRGLRLFWLAPDDFGRYLALAVTVSIGVQALMNMSVVLDIGPTKGIPLPMISYGGSSLLSTLMSLGLLLSVSERAAE